MRRVASSPGEALQGVRWLMGPEWWMFYRKLCRLAACPAGAGEHGRIGAACQAVLPLCSFPQRAPGLTCLGAVGRTGRLWSSTGDGTMAVSGSSPEPVEPSKTSKASKVTRDGGILEETTEVISCSC
ncbi:uncharacterized protein ACIBXB_002687 isoform 1-T6 [Morphnus guianensis]